MRHVTTIALFGTLVLAGSVFLGFGRNEYPDKTPCVVSAHEEYMQPLTESHRSAFGKPQGRLGALSGGNVNIIRENPATSLRAGPKPIPDVANGAVGNEGMTVTKRLSDPIDPFDANVVCPDPFGNIGPIHFDYYLFSGQTKKVPSDIGGAVNWGGFQLTNTDCIPPPGWKWTWIQCVRASVPGLNGFKAKRNQWFVDVEVTKNKKTGELVPAKDPEYPGTVPGYYAGFQDWPWRYLKHRPRTWNAELGLVCMSKQKKEVLVAGTLDWGFEIDGLNTVKKGEDFGIPASWGAPRASYQTTIMRNYQGWKVKKGCCCRQKEDDPDCNSNGLPDPCDINCAEIDPDTLQPCTVYPDCGMSDDCNDNGWPDECELDGNDCNSNGVLDDCDIAVYTSTDYNTNGVPDECDISSGEYADCDFNGIPDECERVATDCDRNGEDDYCGIINGRANDSNDDLIPDACPEICPYSAFTFEPAAGYTSGSIVGQPGDAQDNNWIMVGTPGVSTYAEVRTNPTCGGSWGLEWSAMDDPGLYLCSPVFTDPYDPTSYRLLPSIKQTLEFAIEFDAAGRTDTAILAVDNAAPETVWPGVVGLYIVNSNGVQPEWWVADAASFASTGVEAYPNTCYDVSIVIDSREGVAVPPSFESLGRLTISTDDVTILDTPFTFGLSNMNGLVIWDMPNDLGSGDVVVRLDNIEYCREGDFVACEEYILPGGVRSGDCNNNVTCDHFELDGSTDMNGNGILDACEGFCNDCNSDLVPDDVEIAYGSAPDVNANGIIDWCERSTPATGFEDLDVAEIDGQQGWYAVGGGFTVTDGADSGFPTEGSKYVSFDENTADPLAYDHLLVMPGNAQDESLGLEMWCWDMFISSTGLESVYVEILDLCSDNPGAYDGVVTETIEAAANTGLRFDGTGAVAMLKNGESRSYEATTGNISSYIGASGMTACLLVKNSIGQTVAFLGDDRNSLTEIGSGVETQGTVDAPSGGDRQLAIRLPGDIGTAGVRVYLDNITYEAMSDCDHDGLADDVFLASPQGVGHDQNADGIPDRCQDCDGDCGGFPFADQSCLDPVEIAWGTANDCNGNGIPDSCDVSEELPVFGSSSNGFTSRVGGGSCDADSNGVPDECEFGDDCDNNGCLDSGELAQAGGCGSYLDVNSNCVLDRCEPDCNDNGIVDEADIELGLPEGSLDAYPQDGVPDECCDYLPNGDMDSDGDVDLGDYYLIQLCARNWPNSHPFGAVVGSYDPAMPNLQCGCADVTGDGIVDVLDVAVLPHLLTGPQ